MSAEQTVKGAQIARITPVRETGRGTGHFDYGTMSVHVWIGGRQNDRCAAHIWSPLGNGHSVPGQCANKGKHECNALLFCSTHYPPLAAERRAKREAERKARYSAEEETWRKRAAADQQKVDALDAIKKIADGHNDPRGLAMEVLGRKAQAGT